MAGAFGFKEEASIILRIESSSMALSEGGYGFEWKSSARREEYSPISKRGGQPWEGKDYTLERQLVPERGSGGSGGCNGV